MGKIKEIENALERCCGCSEEKKLIFYCLEYTNYYCPRKCDYAKQKLENEKRRLNKSCNSDNRVGIHIHSWTSSINP